MKSNSSLITLLTLVLSSCLPKTGSGSAGGNLSAQCRSGFGADGPAKKLDTFIAATHEFSQTTNTAQQELFNLCKSLGTDLGMDGTQLNGDNIEDMQRVCARVSDHLKAEVTTLKAVQKPTVISRAPECHVSVDAYAQCMGDCDINYKPAEVEMQCEGGEIRGQCEATCEGRCAVEVHATCGGTCHGSCDGTCTQTNSDGSCNGQCNGTCNGICSVESHASCQGECRGSCSVKFKEPICTGRVLPPQADPQCEASCDAKIDAHAECTPGEFSVSYEGLSPEMEGRASKVRLALSNSAAKIGQLKVLFERLKASGTDLIDAAGGIPNAVGQLGLTAGACAASAGSALATSVSQVSICVEVSVSVSASAEASVN